MAKFRLTKNKTRKAAIAVLCAVTVTCTSLAAACRPDNGGSKDDDNTRAEDTSTLTNGSFEFFTVPDDGIYLIKGVQDWSRSGDSSGTMSGIINTANKAWDDITDPELADKLDKNNDLLSSDKNYKDYNGMKSSDIPYRDTYAAKLDSTINSTTGKIDAILSKNDLTYAEYLGIKVIPGEGEGDDKEPDTYEYNGEPVYWDEDTQDFYFDSDFTKSVRYDVIANPETHYGSFRKDEASGKYYLGEDDKKEIFLDDDGNYYKDADKEYSEGNVLMIHNYPTDSKYNGIHQYYSSTSITLEARTAAKISVWVKTRDLKFDKGYSAYGEQDRGAFIEVVQTVGGTTIDEFTIKAINTQKIIDDPDNGVTGSNGWLQYNIYVDSCDFASSTIQLRLGLGGKTSGEYCTGYAFFDDVEVKKELSLEKTGYDSELKSEIETNGTFCTLSSKGDDKVFYADKAVRGNAAGDPRCSTYFNYLIDLASKSGAAEGESGYKTLALNNYNVFADLTYEEDDEVPYASALSYEGKYFGIDKPNGTYSLYKKATARHTDRDLLALLSATDSFNNTGIKSDYADALKDALLGNDTSFKERPTWDDSSRMLVLFSALGAAYTATIQDDTFTLTDGEQMIVSFWVKTSDMNSKTAATIKIYDKSDKEDSQELTLDTSNITTDIGDEKDINKGWVQCFFFVRNETKSDKTFNIDFSFGNTSIISATSYDAGWAALANMQYLKISEEVYNLNASASYAKKFQFSKDDNEKSHNKFAEALGTYDITEDIALPDGYNGANGDSSSPNPNAKPNHNFDVWDTHHEAGLINRDNFFDTAGEHHDWHGILDSFVKSAENWDEVFGKDCYQPLIIVNNLRRYADEAVATEDTYTQYYVLVDEADLEDGTTYIQDNAGRHYKKAGDKPFDEKETYYSIKEVVNYGFIGSSQTISANSTKTISVRVMVTGGATAYVYLVDTDTREVMRYSLPGYTFWYDVDGNVIDEEFSDKWDNTEREDHTVYELQDNGLYTDKDGNYYANLYNLKKIYIKEKAADGKPVTYYYKKDGKVEAYRGIKCVEGVDYFLDAECTIPAPYRLYNTGDESRAIFEYNAEDKQYYYIVDGKATNTVVKAFDTEFAKLRYDYTGEQLGEEVDYCIKVENTVDDSGKPQWVTVNFVVQTGSESKSYRLELWSGERNQTGADQDLDTDEKNEDYAKGAIAFDYSAYSITSSNYDDITEYYQNGIISKYKTLLKGNEAKFKNDFTIRDYEKLAKEILGENDKDLTDLMATYTAHYYAYSLYDSDDFIPVNKDAGDSAYTTVSDDSETLAFFYNEVSGRTGTTYNMFINYSVVERDTARESTPSKDPADGNNSSDPTNPGDLWLSLASIILVVVLLFVLLALIARLVIKKVKRNKKLKDQSKNVYRKRERYMKKLHIEAEETEEIDNPALQNEEETKTPAEEVTEETPVEEAPAEATEETPTEAAEAPVEEVKEEAPAETTETPSENSEDKPE